MATLTERTGKSGTVTYKIKWTQGGRSGSYESETFTDRRRALRFQTEVELTAQVVGEDQGATFGA